MKINIKKLIELCDVNIETNRDHYTSIILLIGEILGACLIKHYFENEQASIAEILIDKIVEDNPAKGNGGKKLDKWIKVENPENKIVQLYQTEIKNWGVYYRNRKSHDCDSSENEVIKLAHLNFKNEWDIENNTFYKENCKKVLLKMKKPAKYINLNSIPLICFWFPILNPEIKSLEKESGYFEIPLSQDQNFRSVKFFSMSLYLRHLLKNGILFLEFDSDEMNKRFKLINSFMKISEESFKEWDNDSDEIYNKIT